MSLVRAQNGNFDSQVSKILICRCQHLIRKSDQSGTDDHLKPRQKLQPVAKDARRASLMYVGTLLVTYMWYPKCDVRSWSVRQSLGRKSLGSRVRFPNGAIGLNDFLVVANKNQMTFNFGILLVNKLNDLFVLAQVPMQVKYLKRGAWQVPVQVKYLKRGA